MSDEAEIAHQNLLDFGRFSAATKTTAEVLDDDDLLAVAGDYDFPSFRQALPTRAVTDPVAWADRMEGFLFSRGSTACVFTRVGVDDALGEELLGRGFFAFSETPEMVCTELVEGRPPSTGSIRLATTREDFSAYAAVAANAFTALGFIESETVRWLDEPDGYLRDDVVVAVAEIDAKIVAGAMVVLVAPDRAYTAWVAALEEARGSGLGDAVTRMATAEAFDRGAEIVTLEASPFGREIYRRMGYREIYQYSMLIKI